MMLSRRLFLAGPAAVALPAVVKAEPPKSAHEQAMWHIRELERLTLEAGAGSAAVIVVGRPWGGDSAFKHCKSLMLNHTGQVHDDDGLFA